MAPLQKEPLKAVADTKEKRRAFFAGQTRKPRRPWEWRKFRNENLVRTGFVLIFETKTSSELGLSSFSKRKARQNWVCPHFRNEKLVRTGFVLISETKFASSLGLA